MRRELCDNICSAAAFRGGEILGKNKNELPDTQPRKSIMESRKK